MLNQRFLCAVACAAALCGSLVSPVWSQEDATVAEIRKSTEQLTKALNSGKADEVAAMFIPQGEFIDENGTIHQGPQEIKDLLTAFYKKYPNVKIAVSSESIRVLGTVALEEGTRVTTTKDDADSSVVRFLVVRVKSGNGWRIASFRDFSDDPLPPPNKLLQPLAWLEGDWVNEGSDARVKISYRWSEDKNFLLGEFHVTKGDNVVMKTSQRIGWDPLIGKIHSWIFDSDGGFGEGIWTYVGDSWVIKSTVVLPDGDTGSATITLTPGEKGRYTMKGTDRIVGDAREPDFDVTVTKKPPTASK